MNAQTNQIGIDQISKLLGVKERRAKDKLKEWGVQIYPTDPYAKNKFVLMADFLPAYEKYKFKSNTPLEPVEGKLESLIQTEQKMETPNLREPVKNIFLTCKHKIPYKDNSSITCDCKEFKYQAHLYYKGIKNPYKPTLNAINIKDAKIELGLLKAEFLLVGGKKELMNRNPEVKSAPVSTSLPVMPQLQLGQTITPELLLQILGQQPQVKREDLILSKSIDLYIKDLQNENRSKENIAEAKRFLNKLLEVLIEFGLPAANMCFTDINFELAKRVANKFKELYGFGVYYDKAIGRLCWFSQFIIDLKELNKVNYFKPNKIKRSPTSYAEPEMFPIEEFAPLLKVITKENGWQRWYDGSNKCWYKPWLKDAFITGVFMAGRRENVALLKWSDVIWKNDMPIMFKYENLKVNKQKNITNPADKKYDTEDIAGEFEQYLIQKGLYEKRFSDEYVVAPEVKSRQIIMRHCTIGFPHFYSLLGTGKEYNFKQLRKTNFTLKQIEADLNGTEMKKVHASRKTTEKHYLDRTARAYHTKNKTKISLLG